MKVSKNQRADVAAKSKSRAAVRNTGPGCAYCGKPSRRVKPKRYRCEDGHYFEYKQG